MKSSGTQWLEMGRTESVKDCLSPRWEKKFVVQYRFEERQQMSFGVYDQDVQGLDLNRQLPNKL